MVRFMRRHPRTLFTGIVVFWLGFGFVWTYYGWTNSKIFGAGWWFDTAGHFLAGGGLAWSLMFFFRAYLFRGLFRFDRGFEVGLVVIGCIALLATFWEVFELVWDYYLQPAHFHWLAQAQKSALDTTVDIVATLAGAAAALAAFSYISTLLYTRIFPDEAQQEEIERLEEMIEHIALQMRHAKKNRRMATFRRVLHTFKQKAAELAS